VFVSGDKNLFLTLGYVDESGGYSDNGYYALDPGNDNQCGGLYGAAIQGPAWVSLEVDHPLKATAPPYSPGSQPFDVTYNQLDYNGLPLNPEWYAQLTQPVPASNGVTYNPSAPNFKVSCGPAFSTPNGGSIATGVEGALLGSAGNPFDIAGDVLGYFFSGAVDGAYAPTSVNSNTLANSCTSQNVSIDQFGPWNTVGNILLTPGEICSPPGFLIRGHLNWQPVTYTGVLHFSDYSGPWPQDYDVNLILDSDYTDVQGVLSTASGQGGLTTGSISMGQDGTSETYPYGGFLLEFDATETLDPYLLQRANTSWWYKFAAASEAGDRSTAEQMLHAGSTIERCSNWPNGHRRGA
jgi:hypothetical protein